MATLESSSRPRAPPADPLEIRISATVNPSEAEARVRRGMLRIFPDATLETRPDSPGGRIVIEGVAPTLDRFAEIIAQSRIRDAARAVMVRGIPRDDDTRCRFFINKQAAFVGRLNFVPETAVLGPITVELIGAGVMAKIDEMTVHD